MLGETRRYSAAELAGRMARLLGCNDAKDNSYFLGAGMSLAMRSE